MRDARCGPDRLPALICMLVLAWPLRGAVEDPYRPWRQGRPAESLPALLDAAKLRRSAAAWGDAGLAAAAADRRPLAAACLTRALLLDPVRGDTRRALAALQVEVPSLWSDLLGPFALVGRGWMGLVLAGGGGLLLGAGLLGSRRRGVLLFGGGLCLLACLPGLMAAWRDGGLPLAVTRGRCHLLDAAGRPLRAVPGGTVFRRADRPPWNDKVLVFAPDGNSGFLAADDLVFAQEPDSIRLEAE